jgi:hypothetical protein
VSQVTQCYKLRRRRGSAPFGASNTVLLALLVAVLALAAVACGGSERRTTASAQLSGWRVVDDPPGIAQLAPDLGGLDVEKRVDSLALVRKGDAIRASTFTFAGEADAKEAKDRGSGDDYLRALEDVLRAEGAITPRGYRLVVARPAEPGTDTVEIYLVRSGRRVTVVELVSAKGFAPHERDRALAAVSR